MEENDIQIAEVIRKGDKIYKPFVNKNGLNIPMIYEVCQGTFEVFYLEIPSSLLREAIFFEKL